ncbi:hypothetical protein [Microbacterium aurum]
MISAIPSLDSYYIEMVLSRIEDRPRETTEEQFVECMKFLAITSATSGRRIAVKPEVDQVWHELILQTASYAELCRALPGAKFINHESISPRGYFNRVGDREFVRELVQWIPDYVHNFGPFTARSASFWTVADFLENEIGMSLEQINNFGETEQPEVVLDGDSEWRLLGSMTRISELLKPASSVA